MADSAVVQRWRVSGWKQAVLCVVLGALGALGHPPFDLWFLTVAAFVAVFGLALRCERNFDWVKTGFWFGFGYFAVALHWIVEPFLVDVARHGWMAPFALVMMAAGGAAFWAVAFGVAGWLRRGLGGVVALAVAMAATEFLRAYVFTGFPWAMPSYALVNQMFGQLAAFGGPHGVNLLLFLLAGGLAFGAVRRWRWIWGVAGAVMLALWVPVPDQVPEAREQTDAAVVVRLVQPNALQHLKWHPEHILTFFQRSLALTAQVAVEADAAVPDLVVWPETSVPWTLDNAENALLAVAGAARGAPVVLGLNRYEGERIFNTVAVVSPEGAVTDVYDKHHLVPFGEYIPFGDFLGRFGIRGLASQHGGGYSAGVGPDLIDLGALGKALPLVCYEAVFPQDTRIRGERPRMMLHMTNDAWFGNFSGPYQHLAQARMRAIETGVPVLRAANTGISAAIDAQGRVLAMLPLGEAGFLDVVLPDLGPDTLYARWGDLPMGVFLALLIVAGAAVRRRETD
ncbi:Apolipoprotein N-acyltransferase [Shimia sp. SK013]|uniref:apolipoprotein N-acyltransferase n=1 Tax=Shimia sp. SK013 TaxID=1389006 RepID=UPI0006CCF20D|nr:apolipoprotein N-acyltransferase [Shimia sp. SK013]KPA20172.1 Apolipoprotein N-acyltransferase [Shimia sp. SK013]